MPHETPTEDHAAREAVRTRLTETLFVEAGAGTGKTTALVGRVVALAASGVPMRHLAAITFTEAAAAELRDRVRHALEVAADDPAAAGLTPEEGAAVATASAEVDEAAISTLHSFAQRLVTDHPLKAGLPPSIEVLDEIESSLEFEARWRRFVDRLHADPTVHHVLHRSFATGLNFAALRGVAEVFDDQRDRLTAEPVTPPAILPVDRESVLDPLRQLEPLVDACTDPEDRLLLKLAPVRELRRRLEDAGDDLDVLAVLTAVQSETKNGDKVVTVGNAGNKDAWCGKKPEVQRLVREADAAALAVLTRARQEVLGHLLRRIEQDVHDAAAERMRRGRLLFHDLLVAARDLLRGSAEVRSAVADRYRHLLIDEFQDTDPIQVELAVLLATTVTDVGDRPWHDLPVGDGRLFFVGDPKQSIYRFRRADIDLFLKVRRSVTETPLQLTANFRSDPAILDWVNAIFASLMAGDEAPYEPLRPGRPIGGGAPAAPVRILGSEHDKGVRIAQVREVEAAELAATVHDMHGSWPVGADPADPAARRPARWEDIAVLLPTRLSLPYLEQAFDDAQVPYRVESSSLVWGTQQVRDLLAVLQAVDDPNDEVALVAALRSPAFACSDDDLLAYRLSGGRWDLTSRPPESLAPTSPVVAGIATLRRLHDQRWWVGVSSLVDLVVRELGFFELAVAQARPRDHWRRLRFVVDQARRFEDTAGATLRAFLRWAERQADADARVREPVLPETDDDAVRILTVHGSKGLEFPIVVLSGLNRPHEGRPHSVLWDDAGTVQAKVGKFATEGYAAVAEVETQMVEQERHRLLYVAATRARDHLVLSVHRASSTKPTDASVLLDHVERSDAAQDELACPPMPMRTQSAASPRIDHAEFVAARQAWDAEHRRILDADQPSVIAATGLATALADDDEKPEPDQEITPNRRGRAGTAIGRAVHATLQSVDLASASGLDEVAAAQAAAEGLPDLAEEVATLARAAIDSPVVRTAVERPHWRELYVAAPVGEVTVEGFIDLLYDGPDGLVVVDYKTDRIASDADADAGLARHRLQLATYALVVETTLGRPVAGAALVFVRGRESRTRWVEDLPAAVEELRARLT